MKTTGVHVGSILAITLIAISAVRATDERPVPRIRPRRRLSEGHPTRLAWEIGGRIPRKTTSDFGVRPATHGM